MEFICAGKAHTDQPCKENEQDSAQSVYIQRERHADGQHEVFTHVRQLPDRGVDLVCIVGNLFFTHIFVQYFICGYNDLMAYFIAEIAGFDSRLAGKRKYQIHHQEGREKRKGLQQQYKKFLHVWFLF